MGEWKEKEKEALSEAQKLLEKAGLMVEVDRPGETFNDNAFRWCITREEDW